MGHRRHRAKTPAVMLDGMGGSKIGVWIAHGEGKAKFPDESRLAPVLANGQAAVRYVDHTGEPTAQYRSTPTVRPRVSRACARRMVATSP